MTKSTKGKLFLAMGYLFAMIDDPIDQLGQVGLGIRYIYNHDSLSRIIFLAEKR